MKENQQLKEWERLDETTERIVIDYANLSGRESANRAEFRKLTREHLQVFATNFLQRKSEEIDELNKKYWTKYEEPRIDEALTDAQAILLKG